MKKMILVFLLSLPLFIVMGAHATTYYVATTGSNSNNCTSSGTPCQTITGAIGKATAAGSIIQVAAGTYNESLTFNSGGTSTNPITLRGQNGTGCPTTTIADVNHPTGYRPNPSVIVNGSLTLTGTADSWINIDCIDFEGASTGWSFNLDSANAGPTNVQITNSIIRGTTSLTTNATGVWMAGAGTTNYTKYSQNITLAYNYITQSTGIFAACSNCNFHDNEIFNLQGSETGTSTSGNDHDYFDLFGINTVVRHNYAHGNTINSCDLYDCHMDCVQTWNNTGDGTEVAKNITFDRNVCFNHHEGIIVQDSAGNGDDSNWTVTNNVFAYGPWDDGSGHPGPAGTAHSWCWVFENGAQGNANYFYNNTCIDGTEGFRSNSGSAVFKNNLFYSLGTDTSMYSNAGATVTGANNLYYAVSQAFTSGTFTGDIINKDPKIVSVGTGSGNNQCIGCNFNIQSSSPAIDAGVNTAPQVTADLLGNSRPQGAGYDIGAYEYIVHAVGTITGLTAGIAFQ